VDELKKAMQIVATCAKLAAIEALLAK